MSKSKTISIKSKRLASLIAFASTFATWSLQMTPARAAGKEIPMANESMLTQLVVHIIQFMAVGVGVVIVAMMAWAGFRYLSAGDNSNQVSEAKKHMLNIVISLFLYIFGLALLNWLTPGGIFK